MRKRQDLERNLKVQGNQNEVSHWRGDKGPLSA